MKKVLWIDDEVDAEKLKSRMDVLRRSGIECIPVGVLEDVARTIQKRRNEIGLIILDLMMPPEDQYGIEETEGGTATGIALLRDIGPLCKGIPILIVSIRRKSKVSLDYDEYEVVGYLEKPIATAVLAAAIRKHLLT